MATKRKGTTGAVLDLLEVQTALEVCSQTGKHIAPIDAARLAEKIEAARDLLQRSILAATRILEDGQEA
jgi:hypothetical protein